jgi:hypothetical protein
MLGALLALLAFPSTRVVAQATGDQSRLVIGVAMGWVGGTALWAVPAQTILTTTEAVDVFGLKRRLRSNVTFAGTGTWYPRGNLGVTGEVSYLGLGTVDDCTLVSASGDPLNRLVCNTLRNYERPASAVSLASGLVFRPSSRTFIQPYVRGIVGVTLAVRGTVRTVATIGEFGDTAFTIYPQSGGGQLRPTGSLMFGIATSSTPGYQFRAEVRYTALRLPVVTGASIYQGEAPPTSSVWRTLPSILVGFDVVLEKRRGRRY